MFCIRCGKSLNKKNKNLYVCFSCGYHHYVNPIATNGVIFENKDEDILFVKRKYDPKKNCWNVPGGFVNIDETIEESAVREIKEELGIEISPTRLRYFASGCDRYRYKGENYHVLAFVFTYDDKINGGFSLSDDVCEYRFFGKNEIPFDLIAFPGIKSAVKKYLSSFIKP